MATHLILVGRKLQMVLNNLFLLEYTNGISLECIKVSSIDQCLNKKPNVT